MAMWKLEIYELIGITPYWDYDSYNDGSIIKFPPSTNEIDDKLNSSMKFIELYDGGEAIVIPPVTDKKENITFNLSPLSINDEMITKFYGYVTNNTGIRITDHTGRVFEGYFISVNKKYMLSGKSQLYILEIEMHLFDVDGSGSY
jgi:hypothetical protein